MERVALASTNLQYALDNLEPVMMAALGLLEVHAQTGDTEILADLDMLIDLMNSLAGINGDYLEISEGAFALDTYGATAMTGALALINLQYAMYVDNDLTAARLARAIEIANTIDERAFVDTHYTFGNQKQGLFLYPNSIMIIVNCRLYELTQEQRYLDRAKVTVAGIEPLRDLERGGFHSPYSAEYMGAKTEDYTTLSSQNYLSMALMILYENTADDKHLEEARGVLNFIRTQLYDAEERRILHHWMDGRLAIPEDEEYWCSGCNLHTLYVLWYLHEKIGG